MFDIGFWELLLVAVVALIVVGPDKLPGLVRTVGLWVGRARHFASSIRDELEEEVSRAEELKRLVEEQAEIVKRNQILDDGKPTVPARSASVQEESSSPEKGAVKKEEQPAVGQKTDSPAAPQ